MVQYVKSSRASSPNVKVQDVPDVPTVGTPVQSGNLVNIPVTPAAAGGRAAVYRAVSNPGNIEGISYGSSPISVAGLNSGIPYTFTVRGETATGATSGYTSASSAITPAFESYELITTTTLSSSQSSVTFDTSTLSDYRHLQLRYITRTAGSEASIWMRFNGVSSGSAYAWHGLQGGNGSVTSYNYFGSTNGTYMSPTRTLGTNSSTGIFGSAVTDIFEFSNTSKNTTIRTLHGRQGATSFVGLSSGAWFNTAAVTSIALTLEGGESFATGCRFSLYGIRG